MRRFLVAAVMLTWILAACGREGPLVSGLAGSSPSPTPFATAEPTATPEATESPSPSPTATASPKPTTTPPATSTPGNSGIFGSVRAGCPVQPQQTPCPDEPVPDAEVTARTEAGEEAGTTRTDTQGRFELRLPPGTYDVTASSPTVASCETERVTVGERQFTPVQINCETGPGQ